MRKLDLVGMKYPIGCLEQRSVMVFLRFIHHWNHLQSIRNPLVSWNHHLKTYLHGLHHFLRQTFPNRVIILMKTGRPRQPKPSVRSARVPNRSPSHSGRITEPKPKPSVRSVRAPRASLSRLSKSGTILVTLKKAGLELRKKKAGLFYSKKRDYKTY